MREAIWKVLKATGVWLYTVILAGLGVGLIAALGESAETVQEFASTIGLGSLGAAAATGLLWLKERVREWWTAKPKESELR
jgi:hypothetical protein